MDCSVHPIYTVTGIQRLPRMPTTQRTQREEMRYPPKRHAKPPTQNRTFESGKENVSHRQPTLFPLPMQNPPHPLMLFQEQKRHHRMRAQPHKTRHPPAKHPPHALHPKHPPQQPSQPFPFRRRHDTRLNDIHGAADRRRHEPGQKTGAEMRVQVIG